MLAFCWMSQSVEGMLIFKVDARTEQPIVATLGSSKRSR
jgi:hypothetical protein